MEGNYTKMYNEADFLNSIDSVAWELLGRKPLHGFYQMLERTEDICFVNSRKLRTAAISPASLVRNLCRIIIHRGLNSDKLNNWMLLSAYHICFADVPNV